MYLFCMLHACMYVRMCMCYGMYVCMYVCFNVQSYIHTHTHIYICHGLWDLIPYINDAIYNLGILGKVG